MKESINITNYWTQFPYLDHYWKTLNSIFLIIIIIIGTVLNIIVISFITRFKIKQRSRTNSAFFLLNLSICDLLKATTNLPFAFASSLYGEWIFGQIGCDFYGFAEGVYSFTSIGTMVLMTVERFMCIKNPLNKFKYTQSMIYRYILFAWLYSVFWSVYPLYTTNRFVIDGYSTACTFDYTSQKLTDKTFILLMFLGGFVTPLLVIIILYIRIWSILEKKSDLDKAIETLKFKSVSSRLDKNFLAPEQHTLTSSSPELGPKVNTKFISPGFSSREPSKSLNQSICSIYRGVQCEEGINMNKRPSQSSCQNVKRETKVLKITIIAISMFCFAWAPYAVLSMYCQYGWSPEKYGVNRMTSLIAAMFAKSAAIYNPIIYIYLNPDCWIYLKSMFSKKSAAELLRKSSLMDNRKVSRQLTLHE